MFNKLRLVWLVAGRELRDQFRDWRVLAPMLLLTSSLNCFWAAKKSGLAETAESGAAG